MQGKRHHTRQEDWADEVVAWFGCQEETERALREALHRPPSQREETVARMADAVRGAAQGLTIPGCAAVAGVAERTMREWLAMDASFAAAVRAAQGLAEAHGLDPRTAPTPAALQLVLNAIRKGAAWPAAAGLAGISVRGFNRLRSEAPLVGALVAAAQRARSVRSAAGPRRTPPASKPRRPGYRIVVLDDPLFSPCAPPGGAGDDSPTTARQRSEHYEAAPGPE
ncbi:hypothetical protein [Streptomyces sp. NPDC048606]|uniref:hypothetical protein n=1 Tax=Streptomyces sp. NPDC048606 TaxID=3154726 RepID=UPI00343C5409